ncbi:DUF3095 domain-containing protein [Pedobacter hiemivivus]|uniref:DUF3095 domain-containing protein n=1 Tax=Pedobacter hiemivivus TaxID=2530454 RepID=A0A4U1G142_9SPHI|nr:DUF3095 family protein [Pedobacter hiemivivus]TKC57118.1 DUF3095 domain-containing protein [Pedobacter hiemivivus]
MSIIKSDLFYRALEQSNLPLVELFSSTSAFSPIPDDWDIILTDIKNSTAAVAEGKHQTVNLVATCTIVLALNIAFVKGIDIPFFFGGDGATFIVPSTISKHIMSSLESFRANTKENFNLDLRIGVIPVRDVYSAGFELQIAKHSRSSVFSMPVILGNGLSYAEELLKNESSEFAKSSEAADEADLSGMECRWDQIPVPVDQEEVLTLLIIGKIEPQGMTYSKVLDKIDSIYGSDKQRRPISTKKLKLKSTYNRLRSESLAKYNKGRLSLYLVNGISGLVAYLYFLTSSGQRYLSDLVEMSDNLVLDGRINTVISGTRLQRIELIAALDKMESEGEITYGAHISTSSVMSCYVRDMKNAHIHFVDGSQGGYTMAARQIKSKKVKSSNSNPHL